MILIPHHKSVIMKKIFFSNKCFLILLLVTTMPSCYQKFYKVANNSGSPTIDSSIWSDKNKYFILRSGYAALHMENIVVNPNNNSLTCSLSLIEQVHQVYINESDKKWLQYKPSKGESVVQNEVHVYILADSNLKVGTNYILNLNKISKIEILEHDKAKTTSRAIWSTIGIVTVTGFVVAMFTVKVWDGTF